MRRVMGLAIGLLLLASIVSAQTADSARAPMTAEEACKLAYQWTGFDKGRAADLIPKCRAELVDSNCFKYPQLKKFINGPSIWRVLFDSAQLGRPEWSDSALQSQPFRRITAYFDPNSAQLLIVSVCTFGFDTSTIEGPEERYFDMPVDSLTASPGKISLQTAISRPPVFGSYHWDFLEATCVFGDPGPGEDPQVFWSLCVYRVPGMRGGLTNAYTCVNAATGKGSCGLIMHR